MLIRTSAILKKYAQITANWTYADLEASLRMVELKYIQPVLGKDLYDVLDAAITAATVQDPLHDDFVNLLHQCSMAIGPLFCFFHADKADVLFSASGMQRVESNTNKNAYQEQRSKFKETNLLEGEEALEMLQQFLETNQEDYPEWLDSPNFTRYKSLFIKTGTEFNDLFPSHTPYRNYWALRPRMQHIEETTIRKFLGSELYVHLKEEDAKENPSFTEEEVILLGILKKAIANLTVAFAIPFLNVSISSNGLTVPAVTSFSQDDLYQNKNGIPDKMLSTFITSCTNAGTDWITNATEYLTDNETAFASWIGFDDAEDEDTSCNKDLNSSFGMI